VCSLTVEFLSGQRGDCIFLLRQSIVFSLLLFVEWFSHFVSDDLETIVEFVFKIVQVDAESWVRGSIIKLSQRNISFHLDATSRVRL
jgi:hypothetical protein